MGKASNAAKQRWCKANYKQVKVAVPPDIAVTFKAKCMAEDISMASEIARFMCGQNADNQVKKKQDFSVTTRTQRRKTLVLLIRHIEAVMNAECNYRENIPVNLRNSCRYEAADQTVSALEEALNVLGMAYV